MFEKYLQDIGLSEKEAQIYLTLLQVDSSSVLDLSKKTDIKRPTVYVVLESLAKKGLVSETTVGKKTQYHAEPPERLDTFVERQQIMLAEQSKKLKDVIPQIKSIQRESGERPVVKFFEGKEGIISSAEETFTEDDSGEDVMFMLYSKDLLDESISPSDKNKFRSARLQKKIKSKVIYNYTDGHIPSDENGERYRIDENKYPIMCDIAIYKDRVRISTLGENLSSIFIKSQDVATSLRSLFLLAFNELKKTDSTENK